MTRENEPTRFEKPGDQLPGTSHNLMASLYLDELRATPRKKNWPFLIGPVSIVLGIGLAILLFH
jgi:hypothetical protein